MGSFDIDRRFGCGRDEKMVRKKLFLVSPSSAIPYGVRDNIHEQRKHTLAMACLMTHDLGRRPFKPLLALSPDAATIVKVGALVYTSHHVELPSLVLGTILLNT